MNFPDDDGTDDGGIVRCNVCKRAVPCRRDHDAPTPIDPADIRPGDVVDVIRRVEVDAIDDGYILTKRGACLSMDNSARTFHLVHRPDPDAEAVEALQDAYLSTLTRTTHSPAKDDVTELLARIREHGFDVVKRADQ